MSKRFKDKGRIPGQYTAIRWEILDFAAWKQMSMGARSLYIALIKPLSFNRDNNGKIFLSTRAAAKQLNVRQGSICVWYRELEHYGFIVMTEPGTIGPKGRAAHWRITDAGWGVLDGKSIEPTKDYLKWPGEVFDRGAQKQKNTPVKRLRVNNQTSRRGDTLNHSLGVPSETPNASYPKPPIPRSNASYLDQPYPPSAARSAPPHGAVASAASKMVHATPTDNPKSEPHRRRSPEEFDAEMAARGMDMAASRRRRLI
jgi:hypothetical protein